jgi:diguanylate cyclase (GGDEF)-like protein/PAS domain S-box-containing protein
MISEEQPIDLYRDLVEHSRDLLCTHDLSGTLLSVNPLPARLLGYDIEEMLRKPMQEFLAPEFRDGFELYLAEIRQNGSAQGSMILVTRNGERRIWEYHNTLRIASGVEPVVRGMAHDVTDRRHAEAALKRSEQRFRTALENSPVLVSNQDPQLRYTWLYAPWLGLNEEEWLGRTDEQMMGAQQGALVTALKTSVLQTGVPARSEVVLTLNHRQRYFDFTVEPLLGLKKTLTGVASVAVDITELKRAQMDRERLLAELQVSLAEKEYLATHDALTGLPNRRLLADRCQQALTRAERQRSKLAVLAIDLDFFKTVNDRFGHSVGDFVLKTTADRLATRLRKSDTLARTGGDEFAVLAEVADRAAADKLASALKSVLAEPISQNSCQITIGASIGAAVYPDDGDNMDQLATAADRRMYQGKRSTDR